MITKPTLLVDESKCKENIFMMANKAKKHGLIFRPHFKTHQSLEIGEWFKEVGVEKITVSSLSMAEYFSSKWNDITVAFPLNILEINTINDLASRITLNLLIENEESIAFLSKNLTSKINIFIKIDVGYHRTGISPINHSLINKILKVVDNSDLISFSGFLGHAGHTYKSRNKEEKINIHQKSLEIMKDLKVTYSKNYPSIIVSLGDTPGCSVVDEFSGADEIRPGNFVFYDLTQNYIGSNTIEQIAVCMACPIVAVHKDRLEVVIYGGAVHFSKDWLEENEKIVFGKVVSKTPNGWGDILPNNYIKSLSQEHGIIAVSAENIDQFQVGGYALVLPVHSCLTGNLQKSYQTLNGREISKYQS